MQLMGLTNKVDSEFRVDSNFREIISAVSDLFNAIFFMTRRFSEVKNSVGFFKTRMIHSTDFLVLTEPLHCW